MRRIALFAAGAALLACCGGEQQKPPTASGWAARVDAACERATDAVAERGWAADLEELRTLGPEAASDLRKAIAEVRRLPSPASDANLARLFVADLQELEPMLDDVARASTDMDLRGLADASRRLEGKLRALQGSADRAGLKRCLPPEHAGAAVDAIRAPLAAEQIARMDVRLSKRLKATAFGSGLSKLRGTRAALHAHWVALGTVRAPAWAREQLADHASAVRRFRDAFDGLTAQVRSGSVPSGSEVGRLLEPEAEDFNRTGNRLRRSLGATPVSGAAPGDRS